MDSNLFLFLAIMNRTEMNMGSIFVVRYGVFWVHAQKWLVESYGSSIFKFLSRLYTHFERFCTSLHSQQWIVGFSFIYKYTVISIGSLGVLYNTLEYYIHVSLI